VTSYTRCRHFDVTQCRQTIGSAAYDVSIMRVSFYHTYCRNCYGRWFFYHSLFTFILQGLGFHLLTFIVFYCKLIRYIKYSCSHHQHHKIDTLENVHVRVVNTGQLMSYWYYFVVGEKIVVHLSMEAQNLPQVVSRNTVAEIVGSTLPEQVRWLDFISYRIHHSYFLWILIIGRFI
jgi:hypothetical protein